MLAFFPGELAAIQDETASAFDTTAEILRNDGGEETETGGEGEPDWNVIATVGALVLLVTSPGDRSEGEKAVTDERRLIRLPAGTAITSANQLRIGSQTYEVLSVGGDFAYGATVDCQCKRLA